MFRLDPTRRKFDSHAEAKRFFESIKPWRGAIATDARPLEKSRRRHVSIHVDNYDNVVCRYHNTDCVIFSPDDTITIDTKGWHTVSTVAFVDAMLPSGICVSLTGQQPLLFVPGGIYKFNDGMRLRKIDRRWVVAYEDVEPFEVWRINRKIAKEALDACLWYRRFINFKKSLKAMEGSPEWPKKVFGREKWNAPCMLEPLPIADVMQLCANDDFYDAVQKGGGSLDERIRMEIYADWITTVVYKTKIDMLSNRAQVDYALRSVNKLSDL